MNIDNSLGIVLSRNALGKALLRSGALGRQRPVWPSGVLRHDARQRLPLPDASSDGIYSAFMLQHLFVDDVVGVFRELRRVLRQGGTLRLAFNDVDLAVDEFCAARSEKIIDAGSRFNDLLLAHPRARPRGRSGVLYRLLGGDVSRWQPTRSMVSELLRDGGFSTVEECGWREGQLPELAAVEPIRDRAFYVEARR